MSAPAMVDPGNFKGFSLHDLRSVGQHCFHTARRNGEDTSIPLGFLGIVTMGIGAMMTLDAYRQHCKKPFPGGRGR
ncbi:hypothetical protein [Limnoglobus roseus]|uniref:Uncharacterized protein n=1 Tax=Limnoglobus roseus TaxID=2598579 RepID=A0A5C1AJ54_9BACT|nr:hypothetical protein [Limnoglobus roseus]QEL18695.1 hypothetical protein PX52LOC_05730 [Limnoglobus roseus]